MVPKFKKFVLMCLMKFWDIFTSLRIEHVTWCKKKEEKKISSNIRVSKKFERCYYRILKMHISWAKKKVQSRWRLNSFQGYNRGHWKDICKTLILGRSVFYPLAFLLCSMCNVQWWPLKIKYFLWGGFFYGVPRSFK